MFYTFYTADKLIIPDGAPVPRFQFRWIPGIRFTCFYEFVFPLAPHDMRAENGSTACVVQLGISQRVPDKRMFAADVLANAVPFRDGAHCSFDRVHFGQHPVFVIAPDGSFAEVKKP